MKHNAGTLAFLATLTATTALVPVTTQAQQDASESGGLLVSFLEDTLSSESRQIDVQGLEGAFSSQAKIARLTVSDEDGIWLTVEGAELDWNRLALVRGTFSVNLLKADRIIVERSPKALPTDPELPTPEATPFALPDLPVALEIGEISAGEIVLGQALVGQQATLSVDGALRLAEGALDTSLRVARRDRPGDVLTLAAAYANATEQLTLDVLLNEAAGGLAATALDLPGRPDLSLAITGDGPLADFTADIGFATNGTDRISGTVSLSGLGDVTAGAAGGLAFAADLGGDIDPLLRPDFRPFFGPGLRATVKGQTDPDGGLELESLALRTRALQLTGALALNNGVLDTANLTARITPPDGQAAVILPVPGADTTVAAVNLTLQKPEGAEAEWQINGALDRLRTPDVAIQRAVINAAGRLDQTAGFAVDGALDAQLSGFVPADPALAAATGRDVTLSTRLTSTEDNADFLIRDLDLQGDDYAARGEIRFNGVENDLRIATQLVIELQELGRFSALAGQDLTGAATGEVTGHFQPLSGAFGVDLLLNGQDLGIGHPDLDPLLVGDSDLKLVAARDASGLRIETFDLRTAEVSATGQGTLNSADGALTLDARLERLDRFVPELRGPLTLSANFDRSGDRLTGTAQMRGPRDIALDLDGALTLDGTADFNFDAHVGAPEAFAPQLAGAPLTATGKATRRDGTWSAQADLAAAGGAQARLTGGFGEADGAVDLDLSALIAQLDHFVPSVSGQATTTLSATRREGRWQGTGRLTGPGDSTAEFAGSFIETSGDVDLDLDARIAEVRRFAPSVSGTASADLSATRRAGTWEGRGTVTGPAGATADVSGRFDEADGAVALQFDAVVRQLQQVVPGLNGVLTAKGEASRADGVWTLETTADGPLGIDSRIAGTWDEARAEADVTAKGSLRLEGANAFLKPNLLKGLARFDLALRGPTALSSLTGTITTQDAQLVLPQAAQALDGIDTRISLNNGTATISLAAGPRDGGRIEVNGPVNLTAPYRGDLRISLSEVVLTDNLSYDTSLGGALRFSGALAGNSSLSGRIDVGETNINLNTAGGAVSAAPIPPIRHRGQSRAQTATRARAGLIETGSGGASTSRIALDVVVSAPNRIFARGRGLNAELGGAITLRGTTSNPAPSGQIGLIRGTFDILGSRLTLDEGRITLLGDLKPYLELRSIANTEQGTATLEISGRVDSPKIQVTSDPARPSEEALALLLFGDNIQDISPLALARLAGSVLTLSGRGGGAQKALRNATGANNVDFGTDNLGVGQLGLGGYIAENVYTDLNVTAEGDSEVTINLDLSKSLTVTGTADSAGTTGLGVFFKRDY
ncbi:translocation/assembly module TamB domain-containing protein [Tritonibacter horizontis]|uniref:Translocation and assembly module TamB n=1 Tax=Tritonibacter horizontis TaxID=1768241 RepID=A0A132BX73_9RHOB|nr:translocation/assembly module TamB domain-containing protein [Tritonibacter horizontis]KUP92417.1 translocation and assembly module TamB [Tritonibacter horizontis]